jgi:Carboxypeptidase regulatory-like domain
MRKAFVIALLLFPLAAGAANARLHPTLRALRLTPPTFRGSGFHARERVTVSLGILPATAVRVRADAGGRFRVRLAAVPKCGAWSVRAVGSRGSRAVYRHPTCASERTGVEGIVLRGPITPVCTSETPCDAPAPGVTVQALQNGNVVATTATDSKGRFALSLGAGDYTVRALDRDTQPQQVHVTASKLTEVAFYIDTGIR